jgi:hypothetical protein
MSAIFRVLFILLGILPCIHAQEFKWASAIGGANLEAPNCAATDDFGNVYLGGFFNASIDADPGAAVLTLTATGQPDAFLFKLDPAGRLIWARQFSSTGFSQINSIAIDPHGYPVFCGIFSGNMDADPGPGEYWLPSAGGNDLFFIRLNPDGQLEWANAIGGPGSESASGITTDPLGNVYLSAGFSDTLDVDPGPGFQEIISKNLSSDALLVKTDWKGNFLWAQYWGGNSTDSAAKVCVGNDGSIFTMGVFRSTVDFDPGPGVTSLSAGIYNSTFIQKLDAQGNFQWVQVLRGSEHTFGTAMRSDAAGNLYLTGSFTETTDFDPGPGTFTLTASVDYDIFIVKLQANGSFGWAKAINGNGLNNSARDIAVSPAGKVFVCGEFSSTADFNPGPAVFNMTAANEDGFVLNLDPDGNLIWARKIGGNGIDRAHALFLDAYDGLTIAGRFSTTVDFNPATNAVYNLSAQGNQDIFIQKWSIGWDFPGFVYRDLNHNGQLDADEPPLPNVLAGARQKGVFATTGATGAFNLYSGIIGDTVEVFKSKPYWEVQPAFLLADTTQGAMQFGVYLPDVRDLCILAVNTTDFRPGFTTLITLQVSNVGTVNVDSAQLRLLVPEPNPLEFLSTEPVATLLPDGRLQWDIGPMAVGEIRNFTITVRTKADTPIGTEVYLSTSVTLEDDIDESNNNTRTSTRVRGSFDPNDKQVFPPAILPVQLDTTVLQYLIRFQNTGNYPAEFVVIRDTLPAELDLNTLKMQGASHPYQWRIYGNRILECRFDPIFLPDSISDEPGSHGFVAFQVRPHAAMYAGDSILNKAGIYFDFNAPVITAPSVFRMLQPPVGVGNPGAAALDFTVSPNPSAGVVRLAFAEPLGTEVRITLFDAAGRCISQLQGLHGQAQLYLQGLAPGLYQIRVQAQGKTGARWLVVE